MANKNDELLVSLARLSTYDALIKNYIDSKDIPNNVVTFTTMLDSDNNPIQGTDVPVFNINNIDDNKSLEDKTWSSSKIDNELTNIKNSKSNSSQVLTNIDLNTIRPYNKYERYIVLTGCTNLPTDGDAFGYLDAWGSNDNHYVFQQYTTRSGEYTYTRGLDGTAWSEWTRISSITDIVGKYLALTGGTLTGALYIKTADTNGGYGVIHSYGTEEYAIAGIDSVNKNNISGMALRVNAHSNPDDNDVTLYRMTEDGWRPYATVIHTENKNLIKPEDIGASASNHNHDSQYLSKSGGTLTGAVKFPNNTWNTVGDDVAIGDHNVNGHLCIKGLNGTPGVRLYSTDEKTTYEVLHTGNKDSYVFANATYANSGNATNTPSLRNEYFSSTDTTPSSNGQICWTYS